MSKERELLKEFIDFVDSYEFYPTERNIIWEIVNRTQELLAQPEQEPVVWGVYDPEDDMLIAIYGSEERSDRLLKDRFKWIPLYTAPPKREPIEDGELEVWYSQHAWAMDKQEYMWGFRDAEKAHGIGGGE